MILHSKIYGAEQSKIPLLVFHGLFGMADNWATFGREFSEIMPVHLVDIRNHGRSFHSEEMSQQILADDIFNYLQFHRLGKVNLLGHSLGGKAVMNCAISHPDVVHKLIVVDIAPKAYTPHHYTIFEALQSVDFDQQKTRKEVEQKLSEFISEFSVIQFLVKNLYWENPDRLGWRFNLKTLSEKYTDFVGNAVKYGVFEGKTLFISGEKSNYILPQDEFLISQQFPHYQLQKVEKAGHWLQVENPTAFRKMVREFLIKS